MAGPVGLSYLYIPPTSYASDSGDQDDYYYNFSAMGFPSPSCSPASSSSSLDYTTYPLGNSHGRTYLRDPDNPYPFPCDITEIHRQTMRSLMQMRIFGAPFCNTKFAESPPTRVLEIACGSGMWSNTCHEHFAGKGHSNVSFYGVDVLGIAPELQKYGVDWHFTRHDTRQSSLPFPDGDFDFVFIKDASMTLTTPGTDEFSLEEPLRVLKSGGILEVWESDYMFRALLPEALKASASAGFVRKLPQDDGTYIISPNTTFKDVQNEYLRDYNTWIQSAFSRRRLDPKPCTAINQFFDPKNDAIENIESRKVAVPFGEIKWERVLSGNTNFDRLLTPEQESLRRNAMSNVVQMMGGLEPMLFQASGKRKVDWEVWWSDMHQDLIENHGARSGECIEVNAWWAQKR